MVERSWAYRDNQHLEIRSHRTEMFSYLLASFLYGISGRGVNGQISSRNMATIGVIKFNAGGESSVQGEVAKTR